MPARKMPQNLEAEMSVLGVAFLNKNALTKICEELYPEMFYSEANQKLFEAIKTCYDEKIPVDITTVKEVLDRKKNLNTVGGIEYISDVIDSVATAANLDYYIKIVKDKAVMRNLIETATDIVTNAYEEDEDITHMLDEAEKKILSVVKERQTSDFIHIKDAIAVAQENLERLSQNKSDITGLPTGFYDLDKASSGLHAGELIIIAARPGMGKTAFALNIATNAAQHTKQAIAIFNLEMPAEQLVNRMRSAVGQIDSYKIQTGQMNHEDWKRINEANSQLAETNIQIVDDAGITASEIKAKCRTLANKEEGLGLVIIDYLQLVTSGGKRPESRQQEVSDISRALKTMAMELKVPVIALAQLSRSAEKRENNQPMLSDLRESGSIEQDADMVLFINRNDYYKAKEQLEQQKNVVADIIIAKHRKGSTGKFQLLFELNMSNFRNYLAPEKEDLDNE
ncbi:MAG TPA: replicative DNA helicase [Candidatus Coprovivens excrementavium]|nr:replicative DNA helicase [Candidatus Coprovivens excrementavium]